MNLEAKILWAASLVLLVAMVCLGRVTHWADSELWTVSIARQFGTEGMDAGSRYKILFEYLLSFVYRFRLDDAGTMDAARVLFAAVGVAIAGVTALLARRLLGSWRIAALPVFLLTTTSFFISQGFRVRSDLLACVFALAGLLAFLKFTDARGGKRIFWLYFWVVLSALLHLAAFLATPKAFYHILLNAIFIYVHLGARRIRIARPVWAVAGVIFFLGFTAIVWAYSESFWFAFQFFANSFYADPSRPAYISQKAFVYLIRFVNENMTFFLLLVALPFLSRFRARAGEKIPPVVYAAYGAMFLILFHNDRLPFFVLSLLPLPAIACVWAVLPWLKNLNVWSRVYIGVVIFMTAVAFAKRVKEYDSNQEQRDAMKIVRDYVALFPGTKYFDATAALPRTTMILQNVEVTGRNAWNPILETLKREQPEVIFFGNRLHFHRDDALDFLAGAEYVHAGGGAFVKGKFKVFMKPPGPADLDALCPGIPAGGRFLYQGLENGASRLIADLTELKTMPPKTSIGCTKYPPVEFPGGQTFAQVFDYDQDF